MNTPMNASQKFKISKEPKLKIVYLSNSNRNSHFDPSEENVKVYERTRDYIKHEDGLINWRVSWNLTSQGFLFSGLAATISRAMDPDTDSFERFNDIAIAT